MPLGHTLVNHVRKLFIKNISKNEWLMCVLRAYINRTLSLFLVIHVRHNWLSCACLFLVIHVRHTLCFALFDWHLWESFLYCCWILSLAITLKMLMITLLTQRSHLYYLLSSGLRRRRPFNVLQSLKTLGVFLWHDSMLPMGLTYAWVG